MAYDEMSTFGIVAVSHRIHSMAFICFSVRYDIEEKRCQKGKINKTGKLDNKSGKIETKTITNV